MLKKSKLRRFPAGVMSGVRLAFPLGMRSGRRYLWGWGLLGSLLVAPCQAQTLSELLDIARRSDPTYLTAQTAVRAAEARTDQAKGALLPQLNASFSSNYNDREYLTRSELAPEERDHYNSNSRQLNLTQPLWRTANYLGWQQARRVEGQAEAQLQAAEQDLLARLTTAWFDLLAASDNVQFTARQTATTERRWRVAVRGAELGASGRPQVEEAKAKWDQARAEAAAAEAEAEFKRAALEQIVGTFPVGDLPLLRREAAPADLRTEQLDRLLEAVDEHNPNVLAAREAYQAAGLEWRKQSAGHLPTVDLVGSWGKNAQGVGGFPGQAGYDITQSAIGVQINLPLYAGGSQSAKVSEALAQRDKARQDLEAARRSAILAARQAWFGWHAAFRRVQAGTQAVQAAQAAQLLARRGISQGLKTELDKLQAEEQMAAALRDWNKGRYDQLVAVIKLKAAIGALTAEDVTALDTLLALPAEETDQLAQAGRIMP